jgi:hypothetical protein
MALMQSIDGKCLLRLSAVNIARVPPAEGIAGMGKTND